jgi:hypothetical protein
MLDHAIARLPSHDVHETYHTSGVMAVENAQPMHLWIGLLARIACNETGLTQDGVDSGRGQDHITGEYRWPKR